MRFIFTLLLIGSGFGVNQLLASSIVEPMTSPVPSTAFNIENINWAIETAANVDESKILHCPYVKAVNCQWKRLDDVIAINYRYQYVKGNGRNTTDCSIRISNIRKKDFNWWTCEIYDLESGKDEPKIKLRHLLSQGYNEFPLTLVMFKPFTPLQSISEGETESSTRETETTTKHRKALVREDLNATNDDSPESATELDLDLDWEYPKYNHNSIHLSCTANTYVDKCYFVDLNAVPAKWLEYYLNKAIYTTECSFQVYEHNSYWWNSKKYCGLGKEIHLPLLNKEHVVEFICNDMVKAVNCCWRHNQHELQVKDNIWYRNQSVNSKDCSINVKINKSINEVQGLWECSAKDTDDIFNLYQVYPDHTQGHKNHKQTTGNEKEEFHSTTTIPKVDLLLICALIFTIVYIFKTILNFIGWFQRQIRRRGKGSVLKKSQSQEEINLVNNI